VPSVSVIIPTFNRAHCISRAIQSVLAQTFQDIEVIVVDNGSTDGTSEVLAQFGEQIRQVKRKTGEGVAAARNDGIRAASCEWIAFLDSDDTWYPEKLQLQMLYLEKHGGRACFTRSVADDGELFADVEELVTSAVDPNVLRIDSAAAIDSVAKARCHPYIQSLLIRRSLLEKVGLFDESLKAAEDTIMIFRLAHLTEFLYLDRPLVTIYRGTADSLTYDPKVEAAANRQESYARAQSEMYWRMLSSFPEKALIPRTRLAYFASRRAEIACALGQFSCARSYARNGFLLAADWRTFVRSSLIYMFPRFARRWCKRKWRA
jgi:glycosyltransferase involved in cell wall biosynthesis